MNTRTVTTQPPNDIPDIPFLPSTIPGIGAELGILVLAIYSLFKGLISSNSSAWKANQELIDDLRQSLKEKDEDLEDKDNEILILKSRLIKLQKSNLIYQQNLQEVETENNYVTSQNN